MQLTILMPCLNEEKTIAHSIGEAMAYLRQAGVDGEVLICDNASTDASAQIAQSMGARVVTCAQRGYGHALRTGLQAARGDVIIMGDCDMSYDFSAIGPMHRLLCEQADVVIGDRFAGSLRAMPLSHRVGVAALSALGRWRCGCRVRDFHCGLRGVRRSALDKLTFSTGGMEFATEMIVCASRAGLSIAQTPIQLRPDGRHGPSHLRTLRDGWRHLRFLLWKK